MKKIKIAVIGSGWVVENRHLPSLINDPHYEIVCIVGKQKEKLEKLAKKFHIPKIFTGDSTQNKNWYINCDAAMIGTDPTSHYKIAKFCLEHNLHVLVEKPFTLEANTSQELIKIAKTQKKQLGIVHNFQYASSVYKLENRLKNGILGTIKNVTAIQFSNPQRRLPLWYEELPWGLYFDESPHLIYLLDKFAPGLVLGSSVAIKTKGINTPMIANCLFTSKNQIPCNLIMNFDATLSEWYLIINGSKKTGIVDIFRDIYTEIPNDRTHLARNIITTSLTGIKDHLFGTAKSGFKNITNRLLYGNNTVVEKFAKAILFNEPLEGISAEKAIEINKLQLEIISKAQILNQ